MHKLRKLLTAVVAVVAFTAVAANAHAATAEVDPSRISAVSEGKVTFGSSPTIACNLTLTTTLAETVEVEVGEHLGEITGVRISECEGGSVSAVLGLPWELTIAEILGTAPNELDGILFDINNAAFNLSVFGGFINCLYRGTAAALLEVANNGGGEYRSVNIFALEEVLLPQAGGSGLCPDEGGFAGIFGIEIIIIIRF